VHGLIEGRALGREKGFEMWEELGFYEGFARTWQAVYAKRGQEEDRVVHHTKHLLALIAQFPTVNPKAAAAAGESEGLDIEKLQRQIRSRYKALCASLGVKPTLRAANSADGPGGGDVVAMEDDLAVVGGETGSRAQGRKVWKLEESAKRPTMQGLSF